MLDVKFLVKFLEDGITYEANIQRIKNYCGSVHTFHR